MLVGTQLATLHHRNRLLQTESLAKDIALRRAKRELLLMKQVGGATPRTEALTPCVASPVPRSPVLSEALPMVTRVPESNIG